MTVRAHPLDILSRCSLTLCSPAPAAPAASSSFAAPFPSHYSLKLLTCCFPRIQVTDVFHAIDTDGSGEVDPLSRDPH